ncbi:uncharacterized protein MELLADRAFT_110150 [Melampsora larici-populina 98AG31]|uniref:RING-type domain-containing protein n=1 Tax=Melampsora larici-populina (strain 98AG31 / pathotype 3-4-7) TaxID=747676 RepID=F4RYU7_MELLP|nr:uncharacterized protein MELLADRAFT_110150 [Melampsora larici-populina 98AG31]EGG02442.1 hypothetical protein MELLADRAFT_110150 [Melampsora larici-populina 98AG31]
MDDSLKCNIISCRKSVTRDGKAVITNCSHVFCLSCANTHQSLTHPDPYPVCPACGTSLSEPEDVVCTSLNPSADYKASVLAGLAPSIILEIASRALNFWTYQQSMEAAFQHMVLKQAHERAAIAEKDQENMRHQAENEIKLLSERLTISENELNIERRKVNEAAERHRSAQNNYEKLKANFEKVRINSLVNSISDPRSDTPLGQAPQHTLRTPQITPVRGDPIIRSDLATRSFGTPRHAYSGARIPDQLRSISERQNLNNARSNVLQVSEAGGHALRSVRHRFPPGTGLAPTFQARSKKRSNGDVENDYQTGGMAQNIGPSGGQARSVLRRPKFHSRLDHTLSGRSRPPGDILREQEGRPAVSDW